MSADRAAADIIRLNQTFNEQGEKTGKVLANQTIRIRKEITSIRKSNGDIITEPVRNMKNLGDFTKNLTILTTN